MHVCLPLSQGTVFAATLNQPSDKCMSARKSMRRFQVCDKGECMGLTCTDDILTSGE